MFKILCLVGFLVAGSLSAQAPERSTVVLSLKMLGKSLALCRQAYTRSFPGSSSPLVQDVVGTDNFRKDMESLDHAEKMVSALVSDPNKVSGRVLVAILSSSDDFSVGVGSSRAELLRHMVIDRSANQRQSELLVSAEALNNCQRSLFDSGDGFVDVVMEYVGAEDKIVGNMRLQ